MFCHIILDFSTKNNKIEDVLGECIMYIKLLKSITSLSLIGGALLYTNGSDVKAAEAGVFSDVPTSHWSYPAIKDLARKILFQAMEMESLVLVMLRRGSKLQL